MPQYHSDFDRASSQDQPNFFEGGSPEDNGDRLSSAGDKDSGGMQFDEALNGGARAAPLPKIELLDSPDAYSPSKSFVRNEKEGTEEHKLVNAEPHQQNRPRAKTTTNASVAGRVAQSRPSLLRHTSSIHKQDESLPGNFYYLKPGEEA